MAITPSFPSQTSSSPPRSLPTCPPRTSSWPPSRSPPRRRRAVTTTSSLNLGFDEVAAVMHNKVLVAAAVASAIGQLSKPFTSVRNGGGVDFRATVLSGGMPSTHSAAVVAVATTLGLERGFADSVFGMSVVFAAIVMYDAQGVRREVGNHAKALNKMWIPRENTTKYPEEDGYVNSTSELHSAKSDRATELLSIPENATPYGLNASPYSRHSSETKSLRLNVRQSSELEVAELTEPKQGYAEDYNQLSESVGHTELQVIAGALLGFVVSLVIYAKM